MKKPWWARLVGWLGLVSALIMIAGLIVLPGLFRTPGMIPILVLWGIVTLGLVMTWALITAVIWSTNRTMRTQAAVASEVPANVHTPASAVAQTVMRPEATPYAWHAAAIPPPAAGSPQPPMAVAPAPTPAEPRRQTGSVFGLSAGSLPAAARARMPVAETVASPSAVQPVRSTAGGASTAGESVPEASESKVYTYEAPGQPLCPECGERPAIFYCTHHSKALCLQCVVAHDDKSACQYVPAFRSREQ